MKKIKEMVKHPSHYGGDTTYETIKVLKAWFGDEEVKIFCKLNAVKYLSRAGKKDSDKEKQDIDKASWYIDYMKGLIK